MIKKIFTHSLNVAWCGLAKGSVEAGFPTALALRKVSNQAPRTTVINSIPPTEMTEDCAVERTKLMFEFSDAEALSQRKLPDKLEDRDSAMDILESCELFQVNAAGASPFCHTARVEFMDGMA